MIDEFINAMVECGLGTQTIIPDGQMHRFDAPGDKPKTKAGWFVYFDSTPPHGAFGRWQGDHNNKTTWCGKITRQLSKEEKHAYAKQQSDIKKQHEVETARLQAECRAWCENAWKTAPAASPDHPYLVKKQIPPGKLRQYKDTLLIPCSRDGKIQGMQFISPDGSKKFKRNTDKIGSACLIGKPGDRPIVICEGYATGASIHLTTGYAVLVSFDAGNLKPVAEIARRKFPTAEIIIATDNDAWAKIYDDSGAVVEYRTVPCEVDGKPRVNTGVTRAMEAAAIGARVVIPKFNDICTHPTDFNDLYCLEGIEAITQIFTTEPEPDEPPPPEHDQPEYCKLPATPDRNTSVFDDAPFQLLGYDHDHYFFLSDGTGQIKTLTADKMNSSHLMTLAHMQWWEFTFPKMAKGGGFDDNQARNALIQESHKKGVFDPDRLRGLGAWEDKGRSILHLGDMVICAGDRIPLREFRLDTEYIYERAIPISDEQAPPLPASEANRLVQLCELLTWERPINGRLLAGWCVASIICGSLPWRPHVFITGPSGTGKSWIVNNIIKFICGKFVKGMYGGTSEAAMRRVIGNNGFSVFFDEFEGENEETKRHIQSILQFGRACSSNDDFKIYKAKQGGAGVDSYLPRACIGMSAISVGLQQRADISRVSVLGLKKGSPDYFKSTIQPFQNQYFTKEFACGIRARAVSQIANIIRNIKPFQEAVTERLGDRRGGDQYGTLLSCAFSLFSGGAATEESARLYVNEQNWDDHVIDRNQNDERRCLATILQYIIRLDNGSSKNVAELVDLAASSVMDNDTLAAQKTLARHGIKYVEGGFAVSNDHTAIGKMLERTPWPSNWGKMLARCDGATKPAQPMFIGGKTSRAVMLPLRYVREE